MLSLTFALLINLAAAAEPVLSGTVVDTTGKPVSGATLVVVEGPFALQSMARWAPVAAPRPPKVLVEGRSDEAGQFNVSLPAETPELASRRTRLTVWACHSKFALAVRLIDRDWPQAGLPLTLVLPAAASVRIKVTDADLQPAAHAQIAPLRVAGHLAPAVLSAQLVAETDGEGRATLASVVPEDLETVRIEHKASGVQWAGLPAQGRDKTVLLRLAPVGRLTGRLTPDDPQAIAGRKLQFATWQIPGDEHAGGSLADVVTNEKGNYDVPTVAAGSVTFEIVEQATAGGDAPAYVTAHTTGPAVWAAKTTTFEIPLHRAVQVVQDVRDEKDDTPVGGVRVSMSGGLLPEAMGETDASGRVSVHVPPGRVISKLFCIPTPYYYPRGEYTAVAEAAESADGLILEPVLLARGVSVRGRTVNEKERPLAGAEITGFWMSGTIKMPVHAWSNARGEFAIDAIAAKTQVWLWGRHDEATSVEPILAQAGAAPVTLTVGKHPGVSLEGRVVDASGRPVAGAAVRVSASQRQFVGGITSLDLGYLLFDGVDRLLTDAEGMFHTPPWLRPNACYSLQVEAPGTFPSKSETIEPETWNTTRFADMVLHRAPELYAVKGRVIDRQGRAVADAAVWQSGDGPRRTETTTDAEGRFHLDGIYEAPAILFTRKDGYRLQGAWVNPADESCAITLRRADEPAEAMTGLKPALPLEEQRKLAMSLVEPLLPMLHDPAFMSDRTNLLSNRLRRTVSRADPGRALELADTVLADPTFKNMTRQEAALSLAPIDLVEALSMIALLDEPYRRVDTCVRACYARIDAPREYCAQLLDEALQHARTEPDVGLKARELGRIGVCWLDLGERERGETLLREGQALAEVLQVPNEANLRLSVHRGSFAGMLARIDAPAALRLLEGFDGSLLDRFRMGVARGLAAVDPAEAERLFQLTQSSHLPFTSRVAPLQWMAAADAERAARLARSFIDQCEQAFALGTVARGLASQDRAAAAQLLEEAYGVLDRASRLGSTQNAYRDPAGTAAALLPVVEKIDPMLIEEYLWRALSLRAPWPAPGASARYQDAWVAHLAAMIARYDREIARDLLTPLAGRLREAVAEGTWVQELMTGFVAIDPRWGAELVEALGDVSAPPTKNPKLMAALLLAERLAYSPQELWENNYGRFLLRDPDTLDDQE